MATSLPVVVPHESVNDESVKLLRWLVEDGQRVDAGESVAEVEGSKSTFEVPCPQAGVVCLGAKVGDEVLVGHPLCHVTVERGAENPAPNPNESKSPAPSHLPRPTEHPKTVPAAETHSAQSTPPTPATLATADETRLPSFSQRFSGAARELIRAHALDPALFGEQVLVRTRDVVVRLEAAPAPATPAARTGRNAGPSQEEPASGPGARASSGASETFPLSRQKLTEIRYLRNGGASVIPSQVSAVVPTLGLRDAIRRDPAALSLTALIVFETARLLRRHPDLNAFYAEQSAHRYRDVNIGIAVAGEFGLKVPVVHDADQKSAGRIAEDIRALLSAYADNALTPEQLSRGTFTVSDLSGEGVFALTPLIVQGQAAILGVGAEGPATGDTARAFTLTLSFDHQLADGLQAARFLNELVIRLCHHETALRQRTSPPTCAQCGRTAGEIRALKGHLIQTLSESGGTVRVCNFCIAGF